MRDVERIIREVNGSMAMEGIKHTHVNKIKNASFLASNYKHAGSQLLGKTIPISVGQTAEGSVGWGSSYSRSRYFPSW
jgi:hypothetical protein